MAKTERITVWVVTLPNGKKVEVDPAVAARYFNGTRGTTPFSHLHVEPVVRTVRVKPAPRSKPSRPRRAEAAKAKPLAKTAKRSAPSRKPAKKKASTPKRTGSKGKKGKR